MPLLSPDSLRSQVVRTELAYAVGARRGHIVPVVVRPLEPEDRELLPQEVRQLSCVVFDDAKPEAGLEVLVRVLRTVAEEGL